MGGVVSSVGGSIKKTISDPKSAIFGGAGMAQDLHKGLVSDLGFDPSFGITDKALGATHQVNQSVAQTLGLSDNKSAQGLFTGDATKAGNRAGLMKDLALGKMIAESRIPEGSLGRLEGVETSDAPTLFQKRREALEGLGGEALQAQREQMSQGITRSTQTGLRQLRGAQAKSGLRGGAAVAQQRRLLEAEGGQRANIEQKLFLEDVAQKRGALDAFEKTNVQRGIERNIEAKNREMFARLSTEMGIAQMGSAERGGAAAAQAQLQSAALQSQRSGFLGKIICTELYRQGYMSKEWFKADVGFGMRLQKDQPEVHKGYILWATPVVRLMQKSKLFTALFAPIPLKWAQHMAYAEGVDCDPTWIGEKLNKYGMKFSKLVWKLFGKEEVNGKRKRSA